MTKKQKYVCPNCSYDVTNLANMAYGNLFLLEEELDNLRIELEKYD